jgi:phosphoadenosine phosphosulfate reductase
MFNTIENRIGFALEHMSETERIAFAYDTFKPEQITVTTSGGETSAILPLLISHVHKKKGLLQKFKIVFVDTGLYGDTTYELIEKLRQQEAALQYEILTYRPKMTRVEIADQYPEWEDHDSGDFLSAQYALKKEPLERAFRDLGTKLWINGLMRHELATRANKPLFQRQENGMHVLHPIADWSREKAMNYIAANLLPINEHHWDFFKGQDQRKECGIHGR